MTAASGSKAIWEKSQNVLKLYPKPKSLQIFRWLAVKNSFCDLYPLSPIPSPSCSTWSTFALVEVRKKDVGSTKFKLTPRPTSSTSKLISMLQLSRQPRLRRLQELWNASSFACQSPPQNHRQKSSKNQPLTAMKIIENPVAGTEKTWRLSPAVFSHSAAHSPRAAGSRWSSHWLGKPEMVKHTKNDGKIHHFW